jgi:glycosyltransferase involved in cell wall biosynthesis
MKVLTLACVHSSHAGRSGYNLLTEYLTDAEMITAPRRDPAGFWPLMGARALRRLSFSRWYLGGSAELEWKARRRLREFTGVVHSLWSDHDFGYLDFFLDRKKHKLCGTFHHNTDLLAATIRYPARLRGFDGIVLMSECQRPFFLAAGVPEEKIHVVLHGVDTSYFSPGTLNQTQPFQVLSAGGHRRNFPLLRRVCEQLRHEPDIHFEIVAPAAMRPMFEDLGNVKFFTGISDDELLSKYRTASCLLHTAEQATANNVLLEALACGLPIIAERIGGIPEYTTAESAILTAPDDAGALADAIRQLTKSPTQRQAMSAAARERAEELYWPKVAERMSALYDAL